jgi:hypothetical protein
MQLTITIHDSWAAIPAALSRLLVGLAALEKPRQPGDDGDDLSELLAGMDDPEPEPAAPPRPPAPTPATPPAARPADRPRSPSPWDGPPQTGAALYRWATRSGTLRQINAIGKARHWPKMITEWDPGMVAAAYAELVPGPQPTVNGRPH